jgi:hypothetical protein
MMKKAFMSLLYMMILAASLPTRLRRDGTFQKKPASPKPRAFGRSAKRRLQPISSKRCKSHVHRMMRRRTI